MNLRHQQFIQERDGWKYWPYLGMWHPDGRLGIIRAENDGSYSFSLGNVAILAEYHIDDGIDFQPVNPDDLLLAGWLVD